MRAYDHKRPNFCKEEERRKKEKKKVELSWLFYPGARIKILTTRGQQIEFAYDGRSQRPTMFIGGTPLIMEGYHRVPSDVRVMANDNCFLPDQEFTVSIDGYEERYCVKTIELVRPRNLIRSA